MRGKSIFIAVICLLAGLLLGNVMMWYVLHQNIIQPIGNLTGEISRPLQSYALPSLMKREVPMGVIELGDAIESNEAYDTYVFTFPTEAKKVTGLAHIPKGNGPYPVIVQFRGYVDKEMYETGIGTKRSGEVYAKNGYITLAPDFLGYGDSDNPSVVLFEERFQTYTTALDLLTAIPSLAKADSTRVGLWGHSNGGHIALTVLAITGKSYPTVLWAPVSKPFPYSVLYFTDEFADGGKYIRSELARFEGLYSVDEFTFTSYLDRINAPIQLHQGTVDDAVPLSWSDELSDALKEKKKDIRYFTYPGADHNLNGGWNTVVERDISFFNNKL